LRSLNFGESNEKESPTKEKRFPTSLEYVEAHHFQRVLPVEGVINNKLKIQQSISY
jgi:hypothetical protein